MALCFNKFQGQIYLFKSIRWHDQIAYRLRKYGNILFHKREYIKLEAFCSQNCYAVRLYHPGKKVGIEVCGGRPTCRKAGDKSSWLRFTELGNRCAQITTQFPAAEREDTDEPGTWYWSMWTLPCEISSLHCIGLQFHGLQMYTGLANAVKSPSFQLGKNVNRFKFSLRLWRRVGIQHGPRYTEFEEQFS
jgi:hypothetical protein